MKLLPARHINLVKSVSSFLWSSMTGSPYLYGMPPFVSIELTSFCNLSCPECPSGSGILERKKGYISVKLFSRIMEEMKQDLTGVNLYFQGEPMLHPDLFTLIEITDGIQSVLSTNGHFLSQENSVRLVRSGLGKLIVSLDGMSQETYSIYRRDGDIGKVMEGIDNVIAARKKYKSSLKVEIQFLVNRFNEHQIAEVKNYAKKMNAFLRLKSMQVINAGRTADWMPSISKYSRYVNRNGNWERKGSMSNRCARLWFNPVITWDGKVVPCCFDKDASRVMGDLNSYSFRQVWYGPDYKKFRKEVLSGRQNIAICRNCTSGIGRVKA
jgi:radical SAM protein with 4Fe4S-binding SPASM domain